MQIIIEDGKIQLSKEQVTALAALGETMSDEDVIGLAINIQAPEPVTTPPVTTNQPPQLSANSGLVVTDGQAGVVISSALLNVTDPDDSPTELTYTLTTAPATGTLRLSGSPLSNGATWTQQQVNDGLLTYDHAAAPSSPPSAHEKTRESAALPAA